MRRGIIALLTSALVAGSLVAHAPVARAATIVVNSTADEADTSRGDGTCATSSQECTLRAAIEESNALASQDEIHFDIPGTPPHTISPGSALPEVTDPVSIDGTTEPDYDGSPLVVLDGSSAGTVPAGLHVTAGDSTIKALVIHSFNGDGIALETGGNNLIEANFIGTDVTGKADKGNSEEGVDVVDSASNQIGVPATQDTAAPGVRNVISGNDGEGIRIFGSGSTGNLVKGNFIGVDASGTTDLGNQLSGVFVTGASNTTIGHAGAGANLISGNDGFAGVALCGADVCGGEQSSGTADANVVQGNFIGTTFGGTADLGNSGHGVSVDGTTNTEVGHANWIVANRGPGVIVFNDAADTHIFGNRIGLDGLGNGSHGVQINSGSGQVVGGGGTGEKNTIAHNAGDGVAVIGGDGNPIRRNAIRENDGLGIDLADDGITGNDAGDGDSGPNALQNFPVLTSAEVFGGETDVAGTLDSTPGTDFRIEVFRNDTCDPSGNGEGAEFVGETTTSTDTSGQATFSLTVTGVAEGDVLTATATDLTTSDTSEFSACLTATAGEVTPSQAVPLVGSTFDRDDEGWTVSGDPAQGSTPNHFAEDGNPGGYISTTDSTSGSGGDMRWVAPASFLDDKSAAYGGLLTWDSRQNTKDERQFDVGDDVVLEGAGLTLLLDRTNPNTEWTSFVAHLHEDAGWKVAGEDRAPTQQEMQDVLAGLTSVTIRAEFSSNQEEAPVEVTDLDNTAMWDDAMVRLVADQTGVTTNPPVGLDVGDIPMHSGAPDLETSPLQLSDVGVAPLQLSDVGVAPLVEDALDAIQLSSIALADGWDPILDGTPCEGTPLQNLTLLDLADTCPRAGERFQNLTANDIGWNGLLGGLTIHSVVLGLTPLSAINVPDPGWCERIANAGHDPDAIKRPGDADCTGVSLLELQLAGVSLDTDDPENGIPALNGIPMSDIDLDAGPAALLDVPVGLIDMGSTNFGSIETDTLPDHTDVVSCDPSDCPTLFDAEELGAIKDTATIENLGATIDGFSLGELAYSVVPLDANPYEEIPLEDLGILNYTGQDASLVDYAVRFAPTGEGTVHDPTFEVTLPESFIYVPESGHFGSGEFRVDVKPNISGNVLTFEIDTQVDAGHEFVLRFQAFPGATVGRFSGTARALAAGIDRTTPPQAAVEVTEVFEPNDTPAEATEIEPGKLYVTNPSTDFFSFPAPPPGSRITVQGSHFATDLDFVLYHPDGAPPPGGPPFRPPGAHADIRALEDTGPGFDSTSATLLPQTEDIPLISDRLVAGISAHAGTTGEAVRTVSTSGTGEFLLQVQPYLDDGRTGESADPADLREPYTVRVQIDPPPDGDPPDPRTFPFDGEPYTGTDESETVGTLPDAIPEGAETIILFNRDREHDLYGEDAAAALESKLDDLAADPKVNGTVLSVDADPDVRSALQACDDSPTVELCNEVIRQINQVVDARLPDDPSTIKHMLIVGSSEVFPHAALFDGTIKGNETGHASELAFTGNTGLHDAFQRGYFLSDKPYATFNPRPLLDRFLYVNEVGLSRLVETPAERIAQIDNFLASGVLDPSTSLTTGYDDNADLAQQLHEEAMVPRFGDDADALIDDPETAGDSWNRDDLNAALSGGPDVAGLNAHFDQRALLPADEGTLFTTEDFDAIPDVDGTLLYGVGCHYALNMPDTLIDDPTADQQTLLRDWAQAASRAAILVGKTTYGYMSKASIAMDEVIMSNFGERLASGGVTADEALVLAEQSYLAEQGLYDVFDEKVLQSTMQYGIGMFEVTAPDGSTSTAATSIAPMTETDPVTGLESREVTVEPTYTRQTTPDGSFDEIDGESVAKAGSPRVARNPALDVTAAGTRAHGAIPTSLVSSTESGFDPVFDYPTTDSSVTEADFDFGGGVFPSVLPETTIVRSENRFTGVRDHLSVIPQQFRSTGLTPDREVVGDLETASSTDLLVYYSTSDDFTPPAISSVEGFVQDGTASFAVRTTDDASGIARVLVLYRDESGAWSTVDLVNTEGDRYTGSDEVDGDAVEFCVFSVDGAGNVTPTCDKGANFDATLPQASPEGITVTVTGTETAAAGWFEDATVDISGPEGVTFDVSIDGGPSFEFTGPFPVTGEGVHTVDYTASTGESGREIVRIDDTGPAIDIVTPPDGAIYTLNQDVTSEVVCTDGGSGVADCNFPSTVDTSSPGDQTFTATASDVAGHKSQASTTYSVHYDFEGFFEPIDNDACNRAKAGRTIPAKWRLRDANGDFIRDLGVVTKVRSIRFDCEEGQPPSDVNEYVDIGLSSLHYDLAEEQYVYNWKTKKAWAGTQRRFEVHLNDGTVHTALFDFH